MVEGTPISLLARVVVAQDMWWWLRRICGGGGAGYLVGEIKNKANSAQLELELGLSLAKMGGGAHRFLKTVDSTTFWGPSLQIYNKFTK